MKTFVKLSVYFILGMIVLALTEANSKILYDTSIFFLQNKSIETYIALFKAIGYSLATIVIVIQNRSLWIKMFFILLDGFIIWVAYYINPDFWVDYAGFIYGIYTSLIFYFIGGIAHTYYKEKTEPKENFEELYREADIAYDKLMGINYNLEKRVESLLQENKNHKASYIDLNKSNDELSRTNDYYYSKYIIIENESKILNLKRTNRSGKKWDQHEDIVKEIKMLETEINTHLKIIDKYENNKN